MRRGWSWMISFLFAGAAGAAAPDAPPDIAHQRFVLDNGLTVLVHSDHSVPLVAVNLWYHVGSRDEKRGRTGFAHLFEHFFFNGSEHYPHGFREAMDDLGANNRNGTTNTDRTNFFEDVPVSALERTLYLEADRMGWLAGNLSEDMLTRERGVVQNEKRQGENQPYGRVWSRLAETMYPASHPYSWSTIGRMEDLDAASLQDIKDWYAAYYGPNNAVLVLAGDITAEKGRELAQKYFGAIPPGSPVARLQAWVPALETDLRDTMQDRVPQARIHRAWHVPELGARDLHLLELFASVLSGSESSPLDRTLVFEKSLATDVAAFAWGSEIAGLFVWQASVRPGADAAATEREAQAVLARLLERGPTQDELDRARSRALSGFTRGIERLGGFGGRSDVLAEGETLQGDALAYRKQFADYAAATPEAVRDAARRWLGRKHYTLVVEPFPELRAATDAIDRSQLPALDAPPAVAFPELQRATLGNGLEIVLLERHAAPLVNVALAVDAGSSADPAGAAGTAQLAMDSLLKGTRTRDTYEIADERDRLGAQLFVGNTLDQSLLRMSALRAQLPGSLALFADIARRPAFPDDMVEIQRKQQLAAIAQQKANPTGAVFRVLPPLLYGSSHPYAMPGLGLESTVATLPREALAQWHATWFKPGSSTLIVAGDVTMDALRPLVEKNFGDWSGGRAPQKSLAAPAARGSGKVYLIDKPDAPQSTIVAAHLAAPGGTPQDLAIETVMRNFGGMATSRLNRNLRLDKHWSYGTAGFLNGARGPRSFAVFAPVQTDKTRESMVEVRKEILGLDGERPLAGEELDSILRSQVARLPGRFETLDSLVGAALEVVNTKRAPEYYYDYAANMRALDGAALNAAGAAIAEPDQLTWIVVGDLRKIEAGVRELGYGEIVRIDADGKPLE